MLDHVNIVQERLKGEEKTGCMVMIQRAAKTEGGKKGGSSAMVLSTEDSHLFFHVAPEL